MHSNDVIAQTRYLLAQYQIQEILEGAYNFHLPGVRALSLYEIEVMMWIRYKESINTEMHHGLIFKGLKLRRMVHDFIVCSFGGHFGEGESSETDVMAAALLHDVLNDTSIELVELLIKGVSPRTLHLIHLITLQKEETIYEHTMRLIQSSDVIAMIIKREVFHMNTLQSASNTMKPMGNRHYVDMLTSEIDKHSYLHL